MKSLNQSVAHYTHIQIINGIAGRDTRMPKVNDKDLIQQDKDNFKRINEGVKWVFASKESKFLC